MEIATLALRERVSGMAIVVMIIASIAIPVPAVVVFLIPLVVIHPVVLVKVAPMVLVSKLIHAVIKLATTAKSAIVLGYVFQIMTAAAKIRVTRSAETRATVRIVTITIPVLTIHAPAGFVNTSTFARIFVVMASAVPPVRVVATAFVVTVVCVVVGLNVAQLVRIAVQTERVVTRCATSASITARLLHRMIRSRLTQTWFA